jgi:gluconolactonase
MMGRMKRLPLFPCLVLCFVAAVAASGSDFEFTNQAEARKILPPNAKVEQLATGMQFVEGPVWMYGSGKAAGKLIFSDIPANHLKVWDAQNGLGVFREPSNNANGNTLDGEGRLVTAEHGARRVSRTAADGTVETLVDTYEGKKLNSPNDVVVHSNGSIWFTDPDYGLAGRPKEQSANHVFRFDPKTRSLTAVVSDFDKPNGLCFSPDERRLYIADSGKPRHIRVFPVNRDGTLGQGSVFVTIDKGGPDGIRCDTEGRVWSSSGDGVQVFSPQGERIARILLPESAANLAFGGPDGKTLYMTARKSLYAVPTLVRDAKKGKRR